MTIFNPNIFNPNIFLTITIEEVKEAIGEFKRIIRRKLLSLQVLVTGIISNPMSGSYQVHGDISSPFVYEQPVTGILHNRLSESYVIKRHKDIKRLTLVIMECLE